MIDPDFAPKQCDYETGKAVERDGNWLENWSKDLKGMKQSSFDHMEKYKDTGTLYYLNSTGFQINPKDTADYWFIPEQWEAGYAAGKFAEEDFSSRSPLWGTNELYEFFDTFDPTEGYFTGPDVSELYFCELEEGEDPFQNGCYLDHEERLSETSKAIREDYADVQVDFQPVVHNNSWRPSDGSESGFDGWHELHYGWVVVDGKIEVGGSVSGAFTILLQANDSNSRFLVKGEFEVPKVKKDRWVTEDIRANKLEENGNTLCVLE